MCKKNISEFLKENNALVDSKNDIDLKDIKKFPKYVSYENMIDAFFESCYTNDILCRRDFTCCNSCGNAEIDDVNDPEIDYIGYIFYHTQTTDDILDQIAKNNDDINIYLCWGVFVSTEPTSTEYDIFAEKLIKLAESFTENVNDHEFSLGSNMTNVKILIVN